MLDYQSVFLPPSRLTHFLWFLRFGPYQAFRFCLLRIAEWRVRRWERDPAHQEQVQRMTEFARRNVIVPPNLSPEEQEGFVREASHRFRVCWDALRLGAQIFVDRERLMALYLDGSQHHRKQVALHLTSVDKGQMTQPWQGQGVLLDNGHQKLEPFVLTAGRRPRYQTRAVAAVHPHLQPLARLQTMSRQRPQQGPLLAQAARSASILLIEHLPHKCRVTVAAGEVSAAP
jgi:hypothetical protein